MKLPGSRTRPSRNVRKLCEELFECVYTILDGVCPASVKGMSCWKAKEIFLALKEECCGAILGAVELTASTGHTVWTLIEEVLCVMAVVPATVSARAIL